MRLISAFGKSIVPMIIGLLIGGYAASIIVVFLDSIGDSSFVEKLTNLPSSAMMVFTYATIFAAPATLMINWPSYSYLLHKGHASYLSSAYLPVILSLLAAVSISAKFAIVVAIYALVVAWTAHWLQMRFNHLFKPNPQQGGA